MEVRVPRVRLPDGSVRIAQPDWVGQLDGFTLLFGALVLMLAQQMSFAAVAHRQSVVASSVCHHVEHVETFAAMPSPRTCRTPLAKPMLLAACDANASERP
ncbi:hypothetical protein AWB65_05075 [Caballeronia humi]|uniref:Uncharacterized protein n=1 Tax=Caballeronia humi TaxID=326474 RepID=A0A158INL6_9BURK|nr:hypothetical protein AWB65_05075 [Caballeronia humi]